MAAPRAEAQCPGPQPAFSAVVNQQPELLAACRTLTQGGACASPDTPVVDSSRTHAQGTVLQATVPSGFTATSAHWLLQKWNGTTWEDLWLHKSIQGAPHAGGTAVSFGAPGLVESTAHRARVGFCDDKGTPSTSDDECFCWSNAVEFTTTALEEVGPAPPQAPIPMLRKVQDRFDRPNTNPKCRSQSEQIQLGDGLGPPEVWADCVPGKGETVQILNADAWTDPSSRMDYTGQIATHPNSYTQIQVRVDDYDTGAFRYNLQVGTRLVYKTISGMTDLTGYYLKLLDDARGCTEPTMMLVRLPLEYNDAKCDGTPFPHRMTLPSNGCDPNADPTRSNKCDCAPPLHVEDNPGRPGYSKPVWMRVEAWDESGTLEPRFTGAVAWGNCPAGQPMSACQFYCAFPAPRVDTDDPQRMLNAIGTWGASFHEKNYAVEIFDAGSEPAP